MAEFLRVACLQTDIIWKNISANLHKYDLMLDRLNSSDVIVLPEMFCTGFVADPKTHYRDQDRVISWLQNTAVSTNNLVIASHPYSDGENYFNRLFCCFPDRNIEYYDKRHLFAFGAEGEEYSRGKQRKLVEYKNWKLLPLICYDLRFPVWSRNAENYHALIYIANWPAGRKNVWKILLQARAIENQSYVLGVNRTGTDGNRIRYHGESMLVSPLGKIVNRLDRAEQILEIEISKEEIGLVRKNFPFLKDRDDFSLT